MYGTIYIYIYIWNKNKVSMAFESSSKNYPVLFILICKKKNNF